MYHPYATGSKPEETSTPEFILSQAREKAATLQGDELNREILAQLYVHNHNLRIQIKNSTAIKGHLIFYTVLFIVSLVYAMYLASN